MRFGHEVDVSTCDLSELDALEVPVEFGDEGGFTIAPSGGSGFGMVVNATTMGSCASNIGVTALPSNGALPAPVPLLPDCKQTRDVALLGVVGGYHVAWVDNATETAELHRVMLDKSMNVMGTFARTTITDSAVELEARPVLATVAGRSLLTWITRNEDAGQQAVMGKFLDGTDTETFEIVAADAGHDPQGSPYLAWLGEPRCCRMGRPVSSPGVWVQHSMTWPSRRRTGQADGSRWRELVSRSRASQRRRRRLCTRS